MALGPLVDRVGFLMPLGTPRYNTFVILYQQFVKMQLSCFAEPVPLFLTCYALHRPFKDRDGTEVKETVGDMAIYMEYLPGSPAKCSD